MRPVLRIDIRRRKHGVRVDPDLIAGEVRKVLLDPQIVARATADALKGDSDISASVPSPEQVVEIDVFYGQFRNEIAITQPEPLAGAAVWGTDPRKVQHAITQAVNRGMSSAQPSSSFRFETGWRESTPVPVHTRQSRRVAGPHRISP